MVIADHSQNMVLLQKKILECKRDFIITYNQQFSENGIVKDFYDFLIEFAMDCKEKHQRSREANR